MQVILQKTVNHLGLIGDLVNVKPGYFRNFLGPRKLALLANKGSVRQIEHQKKVIDALQIKEKALAEELAKKIEGVPLKFQHATASGDKLFGSVTSQDLVLAFKAAGFELSRKFINLEAPIKTLGTHTIEIRLHPQVSAKVQVQVDRKEVAADKVEKAPKKEKKAKEEVKEEAAPASEATH